MGGGYDFSASGSTSNASVLSAPFSLTDNSGADEFAIVSQANSVGSSAAQTISAKVNWLIVGGLATALAAALIYLFRK